jgi:hypothetical protein
MTKIFAWCPNCAELKVVDKMTMIYSDTIYDLECSHQVTQGEMTKE